ncbi:MAG: acyl-homoserine-lactone synthase [Devosia sp.]
MILSVQGTDVDQYSDLIDQMFRMRATVFAERLGWDVVVRNGRERDRFDGIDATYLLCVNEVGGLLRGAVRLLPTTGPNMLRDVFPQLLADRPIESPSVWESSRFAVNPTFNEGRLDANRIVSLTTMELLCGLLEVAQSRGATHIVSVFDARMRRILRAADCPYLTLGTPIRIGGTMTYAGLFDVSAAMRRRIGEAAGLHNPVVMWR